MKKKLTFIALLFFILMPYAQERTMNIYNPLNVVVYLSDELKTSDYLIYNIDKDYMVINKLENQYRIFIVSEILNVKTQLVEYKIDKNELIKRCDVLDNIFKKDICKNDVVEKAGERYLFFCLTLKSFTECKFNLPTFYYESGFKDIKLPIEKESYIYLNQLFYKYMTK